MQKFFAWKNDPKALVIDAFTVNQHLSGLFWAFPPFALTLKVLKKIVMDQAVSIVIVPYWTSQSLFSLFMKLLIEEPLIFKPSYYYSF